MRKSAAIAWTLAVAVLASAESRPAVAEPAVGSGVLPEWTTVVDSAPWVRRAGLQVVDRDGAFYLMGGRTPKPPAFPKATPRHCAASIWRSMTKTRRRQGLTWCSVSFVDLA